MTTTNEKCCLFCKKKLINKDDHYLLDCLHYSCIECLKKRQVSAYDSHDKFPNKILCTICKTFSHFFKPDDLADNIDALNFQPKIKKKENTVNGANNFSLVQKKTQKDERTNIINQEMLNETLDDISHISHQNNDLINDEDQGGNILYNNDLPLSYVCEKHPQNYVSYFCNSDNELCCAECQSKHSGHMLMQIKDALSIIRKRNDHAKQDADKIITSIKNCIQQTHLNIQVILDAKCSSIASVIAHFQNLKQIIEKREEKLKQEIEDFALKKISVLQYNLDYFYEVFSSFEKVTHLDQNEQLINLLTLHQYYNKLRKQYSPKFEVLPIRQKLHFVIFEEDQAVEAICQKYGKTAFQNVKDEISETIRSNRMEGVEKVKAHLDDMKKTLSYFEKSNYFHRSLKTDNNWRTGKHHRGDSNNNSKKVRIKTMSNAFRTLSIEKNSKLNQQQMKFQII